MSAGAGNGARTMLTVGEVAARWGVGVKVVYAEIRAGRLPHVRLGRIIRISAAVVASVESQGCVVPTNGGPNVGKTR